MLWEFKDFFLEDSNMVRFAFHKPQDLWQQLGGWFGVEGEWIQGKQQTGCKE